VVENTKECGWLTPFLRERFGEEWYSVFAGDTDKHRDAVDTMITPAPGPGSCKPTCRPR